MMDCRKIMSYIKKHLQEKQEKKQVLEQLFNDKKISLKQYSREMNLIDLGEKTLNQINPNQPILNQ